MSWMMCFGNCINCGAPFTFNPERVPSIRVRREGGKIIADPNGTREPVCSNCMARINEARVKAGMEPMPILPGAYEGEEVA